MPRKSMEATVADINRHMDRKYGVPYPPSYPPYQPDEVAQLKTRVQDLEAQLLAQSLESVDWEAVRQSLAQSSAQQAPEKPQNGSTGENWVLVIGALMGFLFLVCSLFS